MLRRLVACALVAALVGAQAGDLVYAQVVADGRTQTTVNTTGAVTDVFTGTVVQETGINSFRQFSVSSGELVNLHVPAAATSLVNLVHESASEIHGVVNAVRNGTIGGRLYFLNPYGIVVGPSGVINAGAVALVTPTAEFMAGFFDGSGAVRDAALQSVLAGQVPVTGNISIAGRINAVTDVDVTAGTVAIDGQILSGAVFQHTEADFSDAVNVNGLNRGTTASFDNGVVRIRAEDRVQVTGTIAAHGNDAVDAGRIEIRAGQAIALEGGAQLLADAGDGAEAGDVLVEVSSSADEPDRFAHMEAGAALRVDDAVIRAGNITLSAVSTAADRWAPGDPRDIGRGEAQVLDDLKLADVYAVGATAASTVEVTGGSQLTAAKTVQITAGTSARVALAAETEGDADLTVADLGFAYGAVDARAQVRLGEGVSITAQALHVTAHNQAELDVAVYGLASGESVADYAVAVTRARVDASALIDPGAVLSVSGAVSVLALNENSFATRAVALAPGDGPAGFALTRFQGDTQAVATLGADVSGAQSVAVEALDITSRDATVAATAAGEAEAGIGDRVELGREAMARLLEAWTNLSLDERSGSSVPVGLASAVSTAESSHKAWANVADGTAIDAGSLVVAAEVEHGGIRNTADAAVASSGKNIPLASDPSAALSAAVATGSYSQDAQAWLGAGASANVANLGVRSRAAVPYPVTFEKGMDLDAVAGRIGSHLGSGGFLTGSARARGEAETLSLAGAVQMLTIGNTSRAYVGHGVQVTLKAGGEANWATVLPSAGAVNGARTVQWDATAAVFAASEIAAAAGAGQLNALSGSGAPEPAEGVAVGASYSQLTVDSDTRAFIAAGARLAAAAGGAPPDAAVQAVSRDQLFLAAPGAGRGAGFGLSGNVAVGRVNTITEAAVDRTAAVDVGLLTIRAEDMLLSAALAGTLGSASVNVGAGLAIQEVNAATRAYVDDTGAAAGGPAAPAQIRVRGLSVAARTDGALLTHALAGSEKNEEVGGDPPAGEAWQGETKDRLSEGLRELLNRVGEGKTNLEKAAEEITIEGDNKLPEPKVEDGGELDKQPGFGLGLSGSVAYNSAKMVTEALLANAHVVVFSIPGGDAAGAADPAGGRSDAGRVAVQAVSDIDVATTAGARAGSDREDVLVALAGAAAVNEIDNRVEALVTGATVQGAREMRVWALAGGDQTAVGIGAAYNGKGAHGGAGESEDEDESEDEGESQGEGEREGDPAASLAGSVSVNLNRNTVRAALEDTQVTGGGAAGGAAGPTGAAGEAAGRAAANAAAGTAEASVTAYNRIRTLAGAGSLIQGGQAGIGAGVSYNKVSNTTEAVARRTGLAGFEAATVRAISVTKVATGGAMRANATGSSGVALEGAFVLTVAEGTTAALVEDSVVQAGRVTVEAADNGREEELDALLDAGDCRGGACSGEMLDFEAAEVREAGTVRPDASAVVSVAGVLQEAAKANVGISFAYSHVSHSVVARVADSDLQADGEAAVEARSGLDLFAAAVGQGKAEGEGAQFSGAGSVTVSLARTTTTASVEASAGGAASHPLTVGSLSVSAVDQAAVAASTGQRQKNETNHALGLAVTHQDVTKTTRAALDGVDVTAAGGVTVIATSEASVRTHAVANAEAKGAALGGSATSALVHNTTEAVVTAGSAGTGRRVESQGLRVEATDAGTVEAEAGMDAETEEGNAFGGAVSVHIIGNTTRSTVSGVDVQVSGQLTVTAGNRSTLTTQAAAGSFGERASGAGSVVWATIDNETAAAVDGSGSRSITADGILIEATDASKLETLAGQFTFSLEAVAGGAAVNYSRIGNRTTAALRGATVHAGGGDVGVQAANDSELRQTAATGETGGWALGIGVAVSRIANETAAEVEASRLDVANLGVSAADRSRIQAAAVQLQVPLETGGGGAAVSHNEIGNTTRARLVDSTVTADGQVSVAARGDARVDVTAAGLGVSAKGVGAGSAASVRVANTTEAVAGAKAGQLMVTARDAQPDALPSLRVTAADGSVIHSIAGETAVGLQGLAVGAAVAVNRVGNTTRAHLAGTGGGSVDAADVLVQAASTQSIQSLAAGVAAGAGPGLAGSTATNFIANEVESLIDGGAQVVAQNNVGVLAESNDIITNAAGAAGIGLEGVGLGLSVSVNEIGGHTLAAIRGEGTRVTALARGGQPLTVYTGRLTEEVDLGHLVDWGAFDPSSDWRPRVWDLRETEQVHGIAVNASSTHSIQAFTVNAGAGGGVGLSGNTTVNVVKGATRALVTDGAQLNASRTDAAGGNQAVSVRASDHAYSHGLVGALSGALGPGVGVAVLTNTFSRDVEAAIRRAEAVQAQGAVTVDARATQGVSGLAVGAGVSGSIGGAGTANVAIFEGSVTAAVETTTLTAKDAAVYAEQAHRLWYATPAVALGAGGLEVGATVSVGLMSGATRAYVADSTLAATGRVAVQAASRSEISNYSLAAAGSPGLSAAGNVAVNLIATKTEGYVSNTTVGAANRRASSLTITAKDDVSVTGRAGAFTLGSLAIGAAVIVTSIRNDTVARLDGASVHSSSDVTVAADAARHVDALGAGGTLAKDAAIGGAAVVTLIGQHISAANDADLFEELDAGGNGTLTLIDRVGGGERLGQNQTDAGQGIGISDAERRSLNEASRTEVRSHVTDAPVLQGTAAVVARSTVDAQGAFTVDARELVQSKLIAGNGDLSLWVSLGGAVGLHRATLNVTAQVTGDSTVNARSVSLSAAAGRRDEGETAVQVISGQGSGGAAALGAAWAQAEVASNTMAQIGPGARVEAREGVSVEARDTVDVSAHAEGYTIGLVAAGLIWAAAKKLGRTQALAGGTATADDATTVNAGPQGVVLNAQRGGSVKSFARAGAGGAVGGDGVVAGAQDEGTTQAAIGHNTTVTVAGGTVHVQAAAAPQAEATVRGYGGGAGKVGVGRAWTEAKPHVEAAVGNGGSVTAQHLVVQAQVTRNDGAPTVQSDSEAVGVGVLLGTEASRSTAATDVTVHVGIGSRLDIAGDVTLLADYDAAQRAKTWAVTAGLGVALGLHFASTAHASQASIDIADSVAGRIGGKLEVNALGRSDAEAIAFSGAGGVVSGAAAVAETKNDPVTRVVYGATGDLQAGHISLAASHTTQLNSLVDTIKASVVGGSGAVARNTVNSQVETKFSDGARVSTRQLEARSLNETVRPQIADFQGQAGSGGLLDGAAVSSQSDITHETRVTVGEGAQLRVTDPVRPEAAVALSAWNKISGYDRTRLDAGGAIEIALAESILKVSRSLAEVALGRNAVVTSAGTVRMAAGNNILLSSSANAKTYGLAGAAMGTSRSEIHADSAVNIGSGARLVSGRNIELYAGRDLNGTRSQLTATASTDLYNKTAFSVTKEPQADAVAAYSHEIQIAPDARVEAGYDVILSSEPPAVSVEGKGYGKDLYRALAEDVANFFRRLVGAGELSLALRGGSSTREGSSFVLVDGVARAGLYHRLELEFDEHGDAVRSDPGIDYEIRQENLVANLLRRLKELRELLEQYRGVDSVEEALRAEIYLVLMELQELGYPAPGDGDPIDDLDPAPPEYDIEVIVVSNAAVRGGDIHVTAEHLGGSGRLEAPSDVGIIITNRSPRLVRVHNLTVEEHVGGHVYFNGVAVNDAAAINRLNSGQRPPAALTVAAQGSSSEPPSIQVISTYPAGTGGLTPDIEVTGNVRNLARGGLVRISTTGSIRIQGGMPDTAATITGDRVELSAGRNLVQSYSEGTYALTDPKVLWEDAPGSSTEPRPGTGSNIAGGAIYIASRYIIINGLLQSGFDQLELSLKKDALQPRIVALDEEWASRGKPPITGPGDLLDYVLYSDAHFTVYYNPETKQVIVDDVHVRGGSVTLYGEILNTYGGRIRVLDGYGAIRISSDLDQDIVLNAVDTGNVQGTVRITDLGKKTAEGRVPTTIYRLEDGRVVKEVWLENTLVERTVESGKTSTYQPREHARYVWTTGKETQNWDVLITFWPKDQPVPDSPEERALSAVDFIWQPLESTVSHIDTVEVTTADPEPPEVFYRSESTTVERPIFYEFLRSMCVGDTCQYYDLYVAVRRDLTSSSLKADYPIAVEFIGHDPGDASAQSLTVQAAGNLIIAGPIQSAGRAAVIIDAGAGSIVPGSDKGAISTNGSLRLGAGKSVGTAGHPLRVELGGDGQVTALAVGGDVYLANPGGALRVMAMAPGTVSLSASGDITGFQRELPDVTGKRVELQSASGSIQLTVGVGSDEASGLRATAAGDIHIQHEGGDLRVFRVESLDGDVVLDNPGGMIIDANPVGPRDERTIAELEGQWEALMLLGEAAQQSAAATVDAYAGRKRAEYLRYWNLRGVQPVLDEDGNIIGFEANPYDPETADEELRRLHEIYGDTEYDPAWTYSPTQQERADLMLGAAWTREDLTTGLSRGVLFQETGSTETVVREPNVVGRNVTLRAFGVGRDEPPVVIDLSDPEVLRKNEAARLALMAAEADDLQIEEGSTLLTVLQHRPVNVQVSGILTVTAGGNVYIGSRSPLRIHTVEAGGSVRVLGGDGLYGTTPADPGQVHVRGGRTVLEGGDGPIGTADNPLRVALQPGEGLTARAGGDIFVYSPADVYVAEMFSRGTIHVESEGALYDARGLRPLTIEAAGLQLKARGVVGTETAPLAVAALNGTASAEGSHVFLWSPGALSAGGVTAHGDDGRNGRVRLEAQGALLLQAGNIAANRVELVGGQGVGQVASGAIEAAHLSIHSTGGVDLQGDNRVTQLGVTNETSGQIRINNTASVLSVVALDQVPDERVWIVNQGDIDYDEEDLRYALVRDEQLGLTILTTRTLGAGPRAYVVNMLPPNPIQERHDAPDPWAYNLDSPRRPPRVPMDPEQDEAPLRVNGFPPSEGSGDGQDNGEDAGEEADEAAGDEEGDGSAAV